MEWPKHYSSETAPPAVIELTTRLVSLLIQGAHPAMATLREQFSRARISRVELTGVGFFVNFDVPNDLPLTEPPEVAAGSAEIRLDANIAAGCVLFVRGGRLTMFEGFTYDAEWSVDALVESVENVVPIYPG